MLDEAIAELRHLNETVPKPPRLPTKGEIEVVEKELGIKFHPDYARYLLEASDVVFGVLEPATIPKDSGHTYIVPMAKQAWTVGVSKELVPIAEDNGNYYCMDTGGHVLYWSHDGATNKKWPDLSTWIREVWIGGN